MQNVPVPPEPSMEREGGGGGGGNQSLSLFHMQWMVMGLFPDFYCVYGWKRVCIYLLQLDQHDNGCRLVLPDHSLEVTLHHGSNEVRTH